MSGPNPFQVGDTPSTTFDTFFGYANPPLLLVNLILTTVWPVVLFLVLWCVAGVSPAAWWRQKKRASVQQLQEYLAFLDREVERVWWKRDGLSIAHLQAALVMRDKVWLELQTLHPDLYPSDLVFPPAAALVGTPPPPPPPPRPLLLLPPPLPLPPRPEPEAPLVVRVGRFDRLRARVGRLRRRAVRTEDVLAADAAARSGPARP